VNERADALYAEQLANVYKKRDRVFAWLFAAQWIVAIVFALVWSPWGWEGKEREVHPHIFYAVFIGAMLTIPPIVIMRAQPGGAVTRHVVAATQMLWSALFIHLTGGRIESHFHVFGSLAFLAFYRDATVLVTATLFVAGDHLIRGLLWSESVYGIANPEWWRFIEHATWVSFENVVLVLGIVEARKEMRALAMRQAELEDLNTMVEETIAVRTFKLKISENRFRTLAAGAPLGIVEVDSAGAIAYANPKFCEIVDRSRRDVVGVPWHDFAHPDDRDAAEQMKSGRDATCELRVISKTTSRWVALKSSPLDDTRHVITFEDVTARHKAERELEVLNRKLVTAARSAGMAEVAAGVLHNVGNVLNSVNTSAEVATDKVRAWKLENLHKATALLADHAGDLPAFLATDRGKALPVYLAKVSKQIASTERELVDELAYLRKNLDHIKTIIQTQQTYARGTAHTERFDAAEVIDDAFRVVQGNAEAHRIELERDIGDDVALDTDRHRVLQIVLNLVGNSIHAIRDGGDGTRRVVARVRADGDRVRIEVEDSGIGIAPQRMKELFRHGYTTKKDGHGFGLHSAANAARELGGTLRVTSPGADRGATFILEIPRAMPRAERNAA
jgi:PAS domain S-box-containing protein